MTLSLPESTVAWADMTRKCINGDICDSNMTPSINIINKSAQKNRSRR